MEEQKKDNFFLEWVAVLQVSFSWSILAWLFTSQAEPSWIKLT